VDRNIFNIPLSERRAELESLPWVEHATVMRLLPDRVRVAIVERTPVAFVRQGRQIGLVDAHGALFDLPSADEGRGAAARKEPQYSFPVLTGISAADPQSTRAARMRIYLGFVAALDGSGESVSRRLSEVDLSNPEDVKAIVSSAAPRGSSERDAERGADILVHFGDAKFLERYRQYEQHLPEWRAQYPRLASVDMRYERQVVLEMQPGVPSGSEVASGAAKGPPAPGNAAVAAGGPILAKPAAGAKLQAAPAAVPVATKDKAIDVASAAANATKPSAASTAKPSPANATKPAAAPHLTTAFAVGPGAPSPAQSVAKPAAKPATEQGAPQ
jgi:cell division protein FtsQ